MQSLCLGTQSIGWILVSEGEGAWEALAWCHWMTLEGGRVWEGDSPAWGMSHPGSLLDLGCGLWQTFSTSDVDETLARARKVARNC